MHACKAAAVSGAKMCQSAVALTTTISLVLADLQEPEQCAQHPAAQHPAAQHYDDSSVISYICQQGPATRCVNLVHGALVIRVLPSCELQHMHMENGLASSLRRNDVTAAANRQTQLTLGPSQASVRRLAGWQIVS